MGIDLGTANTLVHVRGQGIVLNEPSVVAMSKPGNVVLSVGVDARKMLGRTPADIVGGTSEVAVVSLGGIVASKSIRIGGDEMDQGIVQFVRRNFNLLIGDRTAEDIKIAMGSAYPLPEDKKFHVRGRDLMTGLPKTVEMNTIQVREALSETVAAIVTTVKETLEETPPELITDIMDRGVI